MCRGCDASVAERRLGEQTASAVYVIIHILFVIFAILNIGHVLSKMLDFNRLGCDLIHVLSELSLLSRAYPPT